MKNPLNLLLLLVVTGMLGACSGKPNPMPRGYSSFKEPYKSAPGEKASGIGYEFSAEKNQSVLQDLQYAAQDLAERLDARLAFDTDEIYISPPPNNVFYKSLDHLLRAELMHRGYALALTNKNNIRVDIGVLDQENKCVKAQSQTDEVKTEYRNAFIQLAINEGLSETAETVGGFYEVPMYGYKPSNSFEVMPPGCHENKVTGKIDQPVAVEAIKLTE